MKHFVELPNGEFIRADAIMAIRIHAEAPNMVRPYVIVEYTVPEHGGNASMVCTIVNCESHEDCKKLTLDIKSQIQRIEKVA